MSISLQIFEKISSYFDPGYIGKSIEVGEHHNYLTFNLEEKYWKSYCLVSDENTYVQLRKGRRLVLNLDCSKEEQNLNYVFKYSNISPLDLLVIDDQKRQYEILKGLDLDHNKPRFIAFNNWNDSFEIKNHLSNYGIFPDFEIGPVKFFSENGKSEQNLDIESIFSVNY